jgi:putative peptide zinc metalloprotease protein
VKNLAKRPAVAPEDDAADATVERRVELLRSVAAFAPLSSPALRRVGEALREESFAMGESIMVEGDVGDRLFVVVEGRAEATTGRPENPVLLETYEPGEVFGELALLSDDRLRHATVTAVTDLVALSLDADAFTTLLTRHPETRHAFEELREHLLVIKLLKLAGPFSKLDADRAAELANRLEPMTVDAGLDVVREGERGDACYLLRSGSLVVLSGTRDGGERELARLGPGTIVGEAALLAESSRRNATVRTLEPSELLTLHRADLLAVAEGDPTVAHSFVELMRLRDRPKQVAGIVVSRRENPDGDVVTTLKDPIRGAYFRLSPEGYLVWQLLDGEHTLRDLVLEQMRVFKAFSPDGVANTVRGLAAAGFLETSGLRPELVSSAGPSRSAHLLALAGRAIDWQLPVTRIDRALTRLYKGGVWVLYTRPGQVAMAALAIVGLVVFATHLDTARHEAVNGAGELALLYVALLIAIVVHEAGHAFTVKAFGREVPRAGIGWYWFGPIAFVDTSDMWLSSRWPRIAVTLGGPYASLLVAGASSIAAVFVGFPVLWQLAFLSYYVQLLNLNPLLEYDGYFILMDWLERPNLRRYCLAWLRNDLWKALHDRSELARHKLELFYGAGSIIYVFVAGVLALAISRPIIQGWLDSAMPSLEAEIIAWILASMVVVLSVIALTSEFLALRRR